MDALRENFRCIRCGNSCRLIVKVSASDLKRISQAPHVKRTKFKMADYAEPDAFDPATGNHALRHVNGGCVFLGQDGTEATCKIYEDRPEICRLYPFIGDSALPCSALKTWQKS